MVSRFCKERKKLWVFFLSSGSLFINVGEKDMTMMKKSEEEDEEREK